MNLLLSLLVQNDPNAYQLDSDGAVDIRICFISSPPPSRFRRRHVSAAAADWEKAFRLVTASTFK